MDKVNTLFLHSSVEHMCPNPAFDETLSDSDLDIHDKRVARLLVLLRQLDESAEGLEALPEPELSEIVSSALRVCGFGDPIEARDVIAIVLDAIEMPDPIPEEAPAEGPGIALSDA
jgi:hypothetical protein